MHSAVILSPEGAKDLPFSSQLQRLGEGPLFPQLLPRAKDLPSSLGNSGWEKDLPLLR